MLRRPDPSKNRLQLVYQSAHSPFRQSVNILHPLYILLIPLLRILIKCTLSFLHNRTLVSTLIIISSIRHVQCQQLLNISLPVTSNQLIYTPFVCNETTSLQNPSSCLGAWRILGGKPDKNDLISSTNGSSANTGNIIPQVFFDFRAFEMRLAPTEASNAMVNLTFSTAQEIIWKTFNSSLGPFMILNLQPTELSRLAITYLTDNPPGALFEIESIEVTVAANTTISSFLPTPTLPPSASLPTFVLPSSRVSNSTALPSSSGSNLPSRKAFIGMAVGLTLGLGLGLTAISVIVFVIWRRRRRRNAAADDERPGTRMAESRSEWREGTISPHWSWRRVGLGGSVSNRGQVSPAPSAGRSAGGWLGTHIGNGRAREGSGS